MESAKEASFGMVNPAIFEDLQTKIDEDSQVREELKNILAVLEKQGEYTQLVATLRANPIEGRGTQSVLSRAHSTPVLKREFLTRITRSRN